MEVLQKLQILSDAAKYDVSCSSSGSKRQNTPGGIGNASHSGICHSWTDDGRCVSLLKILLTNYCIYDCVYCVNRVSNDLPRAAFTPEEVADLTINFYRRNYIEGLFLSAAIMRSPNHTMEMLVRTVSLLRNQHKFNGYIHLKAIPGADYQLIKAAGELVDRMSVNIELPSSNGLKLLAPQKKAEAILDPMEKIGSGIKQYQLAKTEKTSKYKPKPFVPAGQSTQLIVGATPDQDYQVIRLSERLYHRFGLKRVYYSAYMPVSNHPKLPKIEQPPLIREHRLYQADWLLRFYGFSAAELLDEAHPDLDLELDPKAGWALRNLDQFPVEINKADYQQLLRVPGIGVKSGKRIVISRRVGKLQYEDLKKFGVVLKRARYFITCQGKYYGEVDLSSQYLRYFLLAKSTEPSSTGQQLSLFSDLPTIVTGEL